MMTTGVLWQVDRGSTLSPIEQVRQAVAAVAARYGRRPSFVQVRPGPAWPEEIEGVRIIPTPHMSYPTVMLVGWGEAS